MATGDPWCDKHGFIRCFCFEYGQIGEKFMYQGERGSEKPDTIDMLEWLNAPQNRFQQIWGVILFYHPNWTGMDVPTALGSLVKEMFITKDVTGYRAFVVRKALHTLQVLGYIEYGVAPWDMKDES